MKVPINHYIYFWFINSIMAFATGTVMGYMSLYVFCGFFFEPSIDFPPELSFIFSLAFFLVCQFLAVSFFWGKRRGEFEYSFLEKSTVGGEVNPELGTRLKEVKRELKFGGVKSAHEKLINEIKAFPNNFVVNFMLALSCERMGSADAALEAYETSRRLIPETSQALITYVEKQICRVKLEGPSKMSTAPGLQYLMW
jgi:hypothetical protein